MVLVIALVVIRTMMLGRYRVTLFTSPFQVAPACKRAIVTASFTTASAIRWIDKALGEKSLARRLQALDNARFYRHLGAGEYT